MCSDSILSNSLLRHSICLLVHLPWSETAKTQMTKLRQEPNQNRPTEGKFPYIYSFHVLYFCLNNKTLYKIAFPIETLPVRLHDTSDYRRSMFLPQAHKYMATETGVRGFAIDRQSSILQSGKDNKHSI